MKRYKISYSGYVTIEADSEEEAKEKYISEDFGESAEFIQIESVNEVKE